MKSVKQDIWCQAQCLSTERISRRMPTTKRSIMKRYGGCKAVCKRTDVGSERRSWSPRKKTFDDEENEPLKTKKKQDNTSRKKHERRKKETKKKKVMKSTTEPCSSRESTRDSLHMRWHLEKFCVKEPPNRRRSAKQAGYVISS